MENKSSGSTWVPLLTGVAIGAVLGVLFAPAKGVETRKKVMSALGDLGVSDFFGGEQEEEASSYQGSSSSHQHSNSRQSSQGAYQGAGSYGNGSGTRNS
jgi:gas vesicle protein